MQVNEIQLSPSASGGQLLVRQMGMGLNNRKEAAKDTMFDANWRVLKGIFLIEIDQI